MQVWTNKYLVNTWMFESTGAHGQKANTQMTTYIRKAQGDKNLYHLDWEVGKDLPG